MAITTLSYLDRWQNLQTNLMTLPNVPESILEHYYKLIKELNDIAPSNEIKAREERFQTLIQKFDALKSMIEDYEKKEKLDFLKSSSKLDQLLAFDKAAETLRTEILLFTEPQNGSIDLSSKKNSTPQAILYGLGEPRYINLKQARLMLSQNEEGQDVRTNVYGNNLVSHLGNVFFKRNVDYPLIEQAVYQMSRMLGGGIVTPSRLLILEIPLGKGKTEKIPIQASLAVEGVSLEDILRIPSSIAGLKKILGEGRFLKVFSSFVTGIYFESWLKKGSVSKDLSWEQQCSHLLDMLYQLPKEKWPIELKEGNPSRVKVERAMLENRGLRSQSLFPLIALIESYPELCDNQYLSDLSFFPKLFQLLNKLYPKCSAEDMLRKIERLGSNFDPDNLVKHLVLALLTEPADHKADNFIVKIQHDDFGELLPFEIVAIDNDDAMKGAFFVSSTNVKEVNVKSIIYCLIPSMKSGVSAKFRDYILSVNAKLFAVRWIENLQAYYRNYFDQTSKGIMFSGMLKVLHLDEQIPAGFIDGLIERVGNVQRTIEVDKSLANVFLEAEPILARYYQELMHYYDDPLSLMMALYDKHNSSEVSLEKILLAYLTKDKSMAKIFHDIPRAKITFQSYLTVINDLSQKRNFLALKDNKCQHEMLRVFIRLNQDTKLPQQNKDLNLTAAIFAELYAEYKDAFINLLNIFPKVMLHLEDKLNTQIELRDPLILFQVMVLPKYGTLLVQGLLSYGVDPCIQQALDGYTALHFASRLGYASYIPLLAKAGANVDQVDNQQYSPLDIAIKYKHSETIRQLLMRGAGKILDLENGHTLIAQYGEDFPKLCQELLSRNLELAWELSLKLISQEQPSTEKACLQDVKGRRYLRSEVYKQILKFGDEFPKENDYGRHPVTSITLPIISGIQVGMHLKKNPEFPGREIMVHTLAKKLFGLITPCVALWRFSELQGNIVIKRTVPYPVLASLTISGKPLLDASPQILKNIDHESYCEATILAMLINPEDGRPDNYMLEPFYRGDTCYYRIVSIDNERAFVRPVTVNDSGEEVEGPKGLQVKTYLYCMDLMRQPLHPAVRQRLLNIQPHEFLETWLKGLQQQQIDTQKLFVEKEQRRLQDMGVYLEFLFKPSVTADIYQKLGRLQSVLTRHSNMSLLKILRRVIPELGIRYGRTFENYNTPEERFNSLTKGCFAVKKIQAKGKVVTYQSSSKVVSRIADLTRDKKAEAHSWDAEKIATLEVALERLSDLKEQDSDLKARQLELLQGDFTKFKTLSSDQQQTVINGQDNVFSGIDFSAIKDEVGAADLKLQNEILNAFPWNSLQKLRLKKCMALTDEILCQYLKNSKALLVLEILGCSKLTDKTFAFVTRTCPDIEYLRLEDLPLIQIGFNFPAAKELVVQNCRELSEWNHQGVDLRRAEFHNCEKLKTLRVHYSFKLKQLRLVKCSSLLHSAFYEKYPQLLNIPLERLSMEIVRSLDTGLEQCFTQIGVNTQLIPTFAIDELQKNVNVWIQYVGQMKSGSKLGITLMPLLEKGDWRTRMCAAQVLKEFQDPDIQHAVSETLLKLLHDMESEVRIQAAEALKEFRDPDIQKVVVKILLRLLEDVKGDVRARAVQLLKNYSYDSSVLKMVLVGLLSSLNDQSDTVRESAVETIKKLSYTTEILEEVIKKLLQLLNTKDENVIRTTVEALGKLSQGQKMQDEVIEALLSLLQIEDWRIKARVAEALGNLASNTEVSKTVMNALRPLLNDKVRFVRECTIDAFGKFLHYQSALKIALEEALLPLLEDEDWKISSRTAEVLAKCSYDPETLDFVAKSLLPLLNKKNNYVRISVAEALVQIFSDPKHNKTFDEIFMSLSDDKDKKIRERAVKMLVSLRLDLGTLIGLLKSQDKDIIMLIVEAVVKVTSQLLIKEAIEALLLLLNDKNSDIKRQAIDMLGKFSYVPETQKMVVESLLPILIDGDWLDRVCSAEVLIRISRDPIVLKKSIETLVLLLKDDDFDRRQHAAKAFIKVVSGPETLKLVLQALLPILENTNRDIVAAAAVSLVGLCKINSYMDDFARWFKQMQLENQENMQREKKQRKDENRIVIYQDKIDFSGLQKLMLPQFSSMDLRDGGGAGVHKEVEIIYDEFCEFKETKASGDGKGDLKSSGKKQEFKRA